MTAGGLTHGHEYEFRVMAENALGSLINIPPPREASERLHLALQVLLI